MCIWWMSPRAIALHRRGLAHPRPVARRPPRRPGKGVLHLRQVELQPAHLSRRGHRPSHVLCPWPWRFPLMVAASPAAYFSAALAWAISVPSRARARWLRRLARAFGDSHAGPVTSICTCDGKPRSGRPLQDRSLLVSAASRSAVAPAPAAVTAGIEPIAGSPLTMLYAAGALRRVLGLGLGITVVPSDAPLGRAGGPWCRWLCAGQPVPAAVSMADFRTLPAAPCRPWRSALFSISIAASPVAIPVGGPSFQPDSAASASWTAASATACRSTSFSNSIGTASPAATSSPSATWMAATARGRRRAEVAQASGVNPPTAHIRVDCMLQLS